MLHKGGCTNALQGREAGDAGEDIFGSREHLPSDSGRAIFSACIARPPPPAHKQQGGAPWRRSASRHHFGKSGIKLPVRLRGGGMQSGRVYVNEKRGLWEGREVVGAQRMRTTSLLVPNAVARSRFCRELNYSIRKTEN